MTTKPESRMPPSGVSADFPHAANKPAASSAIDLTTLNFKFAPSSFAFPSTDQTPRRGSGCFGLCGEYVAVDWDVSHGCAAVEVCDFGASSDFRISIVRGSVGCTLGPVRSTSKAYASPGWLWRGGTWAVTRTCP